MENSVSPHQVAEAFYAAFKKLPLVVREEVKTMIETPVRTKKKKYADDTEYLMRNEASRKDLLHSIKEVKEGKNLISYTPQEWDKYVADTLSKIK